jgi:hypothetical protein
MSTSGRIHGEFLRLLLFLSNKKADNYFAALGYEAHKEDFCHRRCVFFHRNRCTISMACAQAVVLCGVAWCGRIEACRRECPCWPTTVLEMHGMVCES